MFTCKKHIGSSAFERCSFSGTLSLSPNVTIIRSSVFSGCKFVDLLTIPEGITDIYSSAFSGTKISSLSLPSTLSSLSSYAFANSTNLNHVVSIANQAASIKSNSFKNCNPVLKLTYPSGTDYSSWASNFPGGMTGF
ncbi:MULTISPECIES: leucine-rich repeat protein [unclassified Oceanispirochaeta]|uniref:leucine-rich repeat protein n=1 Tax=unclassified Oceanispirochaeta TaxID=2635722 RepID=UPI000E090406|nr:leucine-rich repeat protein [Oceanispirochaeta sp. M2]NPD75572.1 leucine-rich repeat domain-containing protein [Oceanispirochaeta sp. M1]RDG28568.1 leucine-rich repeat domain-containing protein [Oceanispirochaeta sp. M1]